MGHKKPQNPVRIVAAVVLTLALGAWFSPTVRGFGTRDDIRMSRVKEPKPPKPDKPGGRDQVAPAALPIVG